MTHTTVDTFYIALPDGHLMNHVHPFLQTTGLIFDGYDKADLSRRPVIRPVSDNAQKQIKDTSRIYTKVIRPQDMPMHVANGNFDLAVSGTDWFTEHKYRFPNSPAAIQMRLGISKVKIVAAVHNDEGDTVEEFIQSFRTFNRGRHLRIASEYVYIADAYAGRANLFPHRVVMTYGATESLIPEDCDMIIENTETGNTLRKNNLKIIDTLEIAGSYESEGCVIANTDSMKIPWKKEVIDGVVGLFSAQLPSV